MPWFLRSRKQLIKDMFGQIVANKQSATDGTDLPVFFSRVWLWFRAKSTTLQFMMKFWWTRLVLHTWRGSEALQTMARNETCRIMSLFSRFTPQFCCVYSEAQRNRGAKSPPKKTSRYFVDTWVLFSKQCHLLCAWFHCVSDRSFRLVALESKREYGDWSRFL